MAHVDLGIWIWVLLAVVFMTAVVTSVRAPSERIWVLAIFGEVVSVGTFLVGTEAPAMRHLFERTGPIFLAEIVFRTAMTTTWVAGILVIAASIRERVTAGPQASDPPDG